VILTSLVVCGLLGGAFVSLSFGDVFGDLFSDDGNDENWEDPNEDIVAAQETVVANNPDSVEDILVLANLLGNTGRLGDAIPLYERALELAPDDTAARVAFAQALAAGDLQVDAEFQLQRTLEIDPNNQQAHYYLAELYLAWNPSRTEEAISHYWRVVQIDPTTLIGERAQTQLDTLGAGTPPASPVAGATPQSTPRGS
jgi:tetratricopeptide (TPR) repeat protein